VSDFGRVALELIARQVGVEGNNIGFSVSTSAGAGTEVLTEQEDGFMERGGTVPAVLLEARVDGKAGNDIAFSSESSDTTQIATSARKLTLCCGNVPFSLITDENPAVPGETITIFASGLGFTAPLPEEIGLKSGQPTPSGGTLLEVPFSFLDFVSALAGTTTTAPRIEFVGLMPGFVGVYQINMTLFEGLPENPFTPLLIAQQNFFSNTVTIPVKPLVPKEPN
jgi:uncharacterized protein (TIGR03437 family)